MPGSRHQPGLRNSRNRCISASRPCLNPGSARRLAVFVAKSRLELTSDDSDIAPADDAFVPEQRQRVVAELALTRRGVSLESIGPAPEDLEAAAVPDDRVERGQ